LAALAPWLLGVALLPGPAGAIPPDARVETVHTDNAFITGMAFAPDGRLFFIEKPGFSGTGTARCWVLTDGVRAANPYLTLSVDASGERGLLGIAIDPEYATNCYVYFYYTAPSPSVNRIIRTVDNNGVGEQTTVIYESPPLTGATNHNGGPLAFGPDGKLYCVIGENAMPDRAQNLSTPIGKVLRINGDGTAPDDNPFVSDPRFPNADKRVWAWGIRNSFGITFHPNGFGYETENGPSCDDEINLIEAGKNYGWQPNYSCYPGQPTQNTALDPPFPYSMPLPYANPTFSAYVYATDDTTPPFVTRAPAGIAAYTGWQLGEYRGDLIYGWNNRGEIWRVKLSADGRQALLHEPFLRTSELPAGEAALGSVIAVADGPDGALYFADSSGTTGRIRRITRPAPLLASVLRALSIAAGLAVPEGTDMADLDVFPSGAPDGRIGLTDAVRKARLLFHFE
jgi:glucose/arabinose dehydrogenase